MNKITLDVTNYRCGVTIQMIYVAAFLLVPQPLQSLSTLSILANNLKELESGNLCTTDIQREF